MDDIINAKVQPTCCICGSRIDFTYVRITFNKNYSFDTHNQYYDACSNCAAQVLEFMKMLKEIYGERNGANYVK